MSKKLISNCIQHLKSAEKVVSQQDNVPDHITTALQTIMEWSLPKEEPHPKLNKELLYGSHIFTPWNIQTAAEMVYSTLGWGYQEAIYREGLITELRSRGFQCQSEVPQPIYYNDQPLSYGNSRIDILVHNDIVLELKADGVTQNTIVKANQQCKRYISQGNYSMGIVIGFPDKPNERVFFNII